MSPVTAPPRAPKRPEPPAREMARPDIAVWHVGREAQPLVIIDGFAPNPDALRAAAITQRFGPAAQHYPGIRAPLPDSYLRDQQPIIDTVLHDVFGHSGPSHVIDASFSIVTRQPAALTLKQRLPHCDSFEAGRIALIHYLSPEDSDGTAFFRHRSTGFETIDEDRSAIYADRLAAELADGGTPPRSYMDGDTALFERTMLAEAHYNRALIYRSYLLHSGAIGPDAALSPDPAAGRLTITGFLSAD